MANIYARLNLASSIFPFYTEAAGRTIMIPEQDSNWDRYNAASTVQDKGVPQVFYMHNVMPIAGGFQSIGYEQKIAGLPGHTDFDYAYPFRNSNLSRFIFVPAQGANYIYDMEVGAWASVNPIPSTSVPHQILVTTASVNGQTYLYYYQAGCFQYNDTTKLLAPVTLTGLDTTQVLGITAVNGYMVAWTATTIAWSSLTDPTNFTPSVQTGAGGGNVQDAKGAITICLPISGGFIIYCEQNAVGASYTGNTSFPFIILGIPNAGGCYNQQQIASQTNLGAHIAYTTAGIQSIGLNSANNIMPEVTDFLAANLYEDFDETTLAITQAYLSVPVACQFTSIGARYIVVSYGLPGMPFEYAIVFDAVLNRYGKLKIPHVSCFEWNNPADYGATTYGELLNDGIVYGGISPLTIYEDWFQLAQTIEIPKQNMAFLGQDGTIQVVVFGLSEVGADGIFILGKLQLRRSQVIVHQRTDIESVPYYANFSLSLLPTYDGKDFTAAIPAVPRYSTALVRSFAKRVTGQNISLLFQGAFNLTSVVVNFTLGGWR